MIYQLKSQAVCKAFYANTNERLLSDQAGSAIGFYYNEHGLAVEKRSSRLAWRFVVPKLFSSYVGPISN